MPAFTAGIALLLMLGKQSLAAAESPAQTPSGTAPHACVVLAPGDHSRVHTHSGPGKWFVLAGAQCLETPAGAIRVHAGETMTAAADGPMQLSITGTDVARALTLVIHDSTQEFGAASDWKPPGACRSL